jgi:hypothetical protein
MKAMVSLQAYFGKTIEDSIIDLYFTNLEHYSDDVFSRALVNIFHNFHPSSTVPFPLISDFIEAIGDTTENRAQLAVTAVKRAAEEVGAYRTIDFGDPALHCTINRFGGWPEIARWGCTDRWNFQEKAFINAYISAFECGDNAPAVAGLHQIENGMKDESKWSDTQKQKAIEYSVPFKFKWRGADFSHQIENKKEEQKMIPEVKNMIDKIGKSVD